MCQSMICRHDPACIRPPDPGICTSPSLVMACCLEFLLGHVWVSGEPVQRVVPSQCVRPFVQESFDGHVLVHLGVQPDHESLRPPHAFPEGHGWKTLSENLRPDNHWVGRREVFTEHRKNLSESLVARAFQKAVADSPKPRQAGRAYASASCGHACRMLRSKPATSHTLSPNANPDHPAAQALNAVSHGSNVAGVIDIIAATSRT